MPFEPGNQFYKNRLESKGGRPKRSTEDDLQVLLQEAWPLQMRVAAVQKFAQLANMGDANAFRILAAYSFGMPRSGDEIRVEEAVDEAVESCLSQLQTNLSESAWREVEFALGIESDPNSEEEEAGQAESEDDPAPFA